MDDNYLNWYLLLYTISKTKKFMYGVEIFYIMFDMENNKISGLLFS